MAPRFIVRPSQEWEPDENGKVPWAVYDTRNNKEVASGPDKSDADLSAKTLNSRLS